MTTKTVPAINWQIDFGAERCDRHKGAHPCKLEVHYEAQSKNVITDYEFGCNGGVVRSDQTVYEAIEWLIQLRRLWPFYETRFNTIIQGLIPHQD